MTKQVIHNCAGLFTGCCKGICFESVDAARSKLRNDHRAAPKYLLKCFRLPAVTILIMNMRLFATITLSIFTALVLGFVLHHLWTGHQQKQVEAQNRAKGPIGFAPSAPAALPAQS